MAIRHSMARYPAMAYARTSSFVQEASSGGWTWENGSSTGNAYGIYGKEGTYSAGNAPGGRYGSASWMDQSDRFWLFGGMGCAAGSGTCTTLDYWSY